VVVDADPRAFSAEGQGDGGADAPARPRHQCHATLERLSHRPRSCQFDWDGSNGGPGGASPTYPRCDVDKVRERGETCAVDPEMREALDRLGADLRGEIRSSEAGVRVYVDGSIQASAAETRAYVDERIQTSAAETRVCA